MMKQMIPIWILLLCVCAGKARAQNDPVLAGMIVADGGMLALGVMFLVLSLVCRYGAEREAMKQE